VICFFVKHEETKLLGPFRKDFGRTLLLEKVVNGSKSWIFRYDPEIERQNLQWKIPESSRSK
jgi:hypothetical protein